ncbi:DUF6094 domain-containing protein [Clostridium botulinum]|uniref:DUF6094 domain-containing protein n=1 Tax=Clostridium botulinum TaxID=1491 RepID=A0A0M1LCC8_CLOBO|nr:DUF6094 domain-containing protein [Clostridium botulinum]KOR55301.1 hypothetical protein ADT22_16965 [Clostridium botulinum]MCS6112645.1 hypothetical protein [Clostridium botulinum]NFF88446.1 hypothetical protein [Clostridium botulinum]NFG11402.1 hypothetical protein [Clostridium botulinum]NFL43297.1 hypothetical protein [Clostridium botulinum]
MNSITKRRMNSARQWGNEGKLGFFPTNKSIVDMEMNLIDFSELQGSDVTLNIADLSGGEGEQLNWMYQYLQNNNIKAEAYYNELAEERFNKGMINYPYFNGVNTDIFELRVANKSNRNLNKKVFSIIRDNPPYIWLNKGDRNVRAEYEFFIKNSLLDINGGIHIFELPIHQLLGINNLISIINYRYEMEIFKFPKGEFEKFKQVVVICKKRTVAQRDNARIGEIKFNLENNNIPYLDEVDGPVFKVHYNDFKKTPPINLFRNGRVTDNTLANGLNQVLDELLSADKKDSEVVSIERGKPLIELMPGHISQILASGGYNGLMGNLLIKGGSNKVIQVIKETEDDKEITTEVEVLKPYLELTNSKGDILYRNF